MAFFSFLDSNKNNKPDAKGVFRFLGKVARGDEKEGGGVFGFLDQAVGTPTRVRDTAVATAREYAKIPFNIGVSQLESATKTINSVAGTKLPEKIVVDPSTNPISSAIFGKEPIKSYEVRRQGAQKSLEEGTSILGDKKFDPSVAGPLSVLGMLGIVASDATPGGGAKKGIVQQLIKADTPEAVKKVLKGANDDMARAIAQTQDPNVIDNIIRQEATRQMPPPPIDETPATPPPGTKSLDEFVQEQETVTRELADGRAVSYLDPATRTRYLQEVAAGAKANGGFTHSLDRLEQPTEGIGYAPSKSTEFAVKDIDDKTLDDYIGKYYDELTKEENRLGGWYDEETERWILDVSRVEPLSPESIAKAQAAQQDAVWDFSTQSEIRIGQKDANGVYSILDEPAKIYDQHIAGRDQGAVYPEGKVANEGAVLDDAQASKQATTKTTSPDEVVSLKQEARNSKNAESFARKIGFTTKEAGDNLILYKGTGGELDMGGSRGFDYFNKVADSKASMPKNTTSYTQNFVRAQDYGKVKAFSIPKSAVLDEGAYTDLLIKQLEKVDGVKYTPADIASIKQYPSAYSGLWRRADKYPSLISDIKKSGFKAFKDTNGEVVVLDKSSVTDLYKSAQSQPPKSPPKPPKPTTTEPKPSGQKRDRAFIQTVKKSDTEQPKAAEAASAVKPQKLRSRPNQKTYERAKQIVEEDYDAAVARVKSPVADLDTLDETGAIAQVLVQKALREDRIDDATELIDIATRNFTATGRGSQIASLWSRMSPEGVLKITQRRVKAAREKSKNFEKNEANTKQLAGEIQDEVENSLKIDRGDVQKTIDGIIDDVIVDEKTVAEQVAKRVGDSLTPKKKKKVDELVNELTKKIKQERMAPVPKSTKKSPKQILQEVLARSPEAKDAYPEVKDILRARFADQPAVLKQLDEFFESELGLPPAISTVNRAIKDQLQANGTKIREVIYKSWDQQKTSVEDIAKALVKEGFDEKTAKSLADEVRYRLFLELGDAKAKLLERWATDLPEKQAQNIFNKIEKLSNVGALNNADYLSIARTRLKLPDLTSEMAARLSAMAQELQKLPDGKAKNELMADMIDVMNSAVPVTKGEKFTAFRYQNILSGPLTTLRNIAGSLTNGLIARPATLAIKATKDAFGSVLTGKARESYFSDVPEYFRGMFDAYYDANEAMKRAWSGKGYISNPDFSAALKGRSNQLPKKYTVITRFMEAQDRWFQTMIAGGEYAVQKAKGASDDVARDAAEQAARYSLFRKPLDPDNLSGQGALLSKMDQATGALQQTANKFPLMRWFVPFISTPMNITKQFIEYSPLGFTTLYKASGDAAADQAARAVLGSMISLTAAQLALEGKTTWAVPKSEKEREAFYAAGKKPYSIQIGDKWVPMITFGPFAYALALPASIRDAHERAPMDANQMEILANTLTGQARFFSGQTYVQGMSNFIDAISGNSPETTQTALAGIASQAVPLEGLKRYITNVVDPVFRKKEGITDQFRSTTPFASKKLEAYEDPETGEESRRNLSNYVAPYAMGEAKGDKASKKQKTAVSDFYKTLGKSSALRTKANEDINEAIKEGDSAKAKQIAKDYNTKYAESFSWWLDKYGDSASNEELIKEYNKRKIRLTTSRIKARRRNIIKKEKQRDIYSAVRGQ